MQQNTYGMRLFEAVFRGSVKTGALTRLTPHSVMCTFLSQGEAFLSKEWCVCLQFLLSSNLPVKILDHSF